MPFGLRIAHKLPDNSLGFKHEFQLRQLKSLWWAAKGKSKAKPKSTPTRAAATPRSILPPPPPRFSLSLCLLITHHLKEFINIRTKPQLSLFSPVSLSGARLQSHLNWSLQNYQSSCTKETERERGREKRASRAERERESENTQLFSLHNGPASLLLLRAKQRLNVNVNVNLKLNYS